MQAVDSTGLKLWALERTTAHAPQKCATGLRPHPSWLYPCPRVPASVHASKRKENPGRGWQVKCKKAAVKMRQERKGEKSEERLSLSSGLTKTVQALCLAKGAS